MNFGRKMEKSNMDTSELAKGVIGDDGTSLGDFLHNYAKKLANSISDRGESELEFINDPLEESNRPRRAAANDAVAGSLHNYAKKYSNIIAGHEYVSGEGNVFIDKLGVNETSRATSKIYSETDGPVTQLDYAKKVFNDPKSSLDPEFSSETRKEFNHECNKITSYAGDIDSGHDYAKKIVNSHDNLKNNYNILKESRKESNESITNHDLHDYAKKLVNESICDSNFQRELENKTKEPSQSVTNKDDSRVSLHDYAKNIDDFENLLSTSIFNSDISKAMRNHNQYADRLCKSVISNSEICDEVHNYAKKVSIQIVGSEKNTNIGIDCLENTSDLDSRRNLIHSYAKKFVGCSSNLSDKTEEIYKEFNENSKELGKSVINDRNCEVSSVHDYAKRIEKEKIGLEETSHLLLSGKTEGYLHNESTIHCKSNADDRRICGAIFVHDYAKKITHVSVDHDILLKSTSDKEWVINEVDRESNGFGRQSVSTNEAFGQESVHDYAKKMNNVANEHERLPNYVEMLEEESIVEEYNVSCKKVENEVDKVSNKSFKPMSEDYVISSETCVHDYAKKAVNRIRDYEKLFDAVCDIEEGKSDGELDKPRRLVANHAVCDTSYIVNDNEKMHVEDHGKTLESDCDYEMLQNEIPVENNKSYEDCKLVEDEIHEKILELDKDVPNNEKHFIVDHKSVESLKFLEIKHNEVGEESATSKSVEAHQESNELVPYDNAAQWGNCEKQITHAIVDQEGMSLCDNETLEVDSNEIIDEFSELDKILANDDGACGEVLVEDYVKEITNVILDCFPDNECDVEMMEVDRNEVNDESFKKITSEVVRESYELDKSSPNGEQQNDDVGDSGWQSIRTVACLFCDDMFETISVLYRHVSKYHWELKERLKIEDSEVRCKQCDEMVNYSQMHDHMLGHLPAENKCHYCHLVFQSLKRLENHVNTHIFTEHFCSYCGMQFANNRNKMIHISSVHTEQKDILCDSCGLQFQSLPQLKIHLKKVHHKISEYFCSYCGKEFSNDANKMNHMKVHTMPDPRQILCEVCGRLFVDHRSLVSHQRVHEKQGDYVCETCTKSFQTQTELDAHTSTHLKAFSCKVCSKRFHKKYLVRQHMLSHTEMKAYSCFCGATFNRVGNYKRHTNKHNSVASKNDEPTSATVCGICKRDLKTETRLRWHEAKHAGEKKPFDCDLCGSRFAKLSYYKVHMMKHTGERPFTCAVCQQGFRTQHTLQQHTAHVHMDIYSFKCDECGLLFKQRNALTNHKVTHTGDKPYECYICGRRYTQNASLSRHLKTHADCFTPLLEPFSDAFIELESVLNAPPFSFTTANEPALPTFE